MLTAQLTVATPQRLNFTISMYTGYACEAEDRRIDDRAVAASHSAEMGDTSSAILQLPGRWSRRVIAVTV